MRIGELFAGYGGLGMGVQAAIGGEVVWVSEIDEAASLVLETRLGVPNLGDITAIDWTAVPPVDVLTGGFPCQDVSLAGNRAGLTEGTRSGLWSYMADAIAVLRPGLVVIENVGGLLSAPAASDVEPCPWCLGDTGDQHHLRALGAVLGDLADIGYDASWTVVPASDVGAPHRRRRVFVLAWPAAGSRSEAVSQRAGLRASQPRGIRWGRPDHDGCAASADGNGPGREGAQPAPGRDVPHGRTAADATGSRLGRSASGIGAGWDATERGQAFDQPVDGDRAWAAAADTDGAGIKARGGRPRAGDSRRLQPVVSGDTDWGAYAPAITRWERVTGRPAPAPVEPGVRSAAVLSARFVEWLMGLPEGWVTDLVPRNAALKMLGNGVVPQQATAAVLDLLRDVPWRAAA